MIGIKLMRTIGWVFGAVPYLNYNQKKWKFFFFGNQIYCISDPTASTAMTHLLINTMPY